MPSTANHKSTEVQVPAKSKAVKAGTLEADCLKWIQTTDYVTFAELERWLAERGVDVDGDHAIEIAPNVVLWAGVSGEFCRIVEAIRPALDLAPCSSLLVYLVDGKALTLPIAKRPPRAGYAKPRWLPVTMRTKQRPTRDEIRGAPAEVAAARNGRAS